MSSEPLATNKEDTGITSAEPCKVLQDPQPPRNQSRVSGSSTSQLKHLIAAEPDKPEASQGAGAPQCCRPTLQIIPSPIPKRSQRSWQTRSINFDAVN